MNGPTDGPAGVAPDAAPTEPAPWALQLAARVEKLNPPLVTDIAAAAALATIELVGHDNAQPDGPWFEPVEAWQGGGRIRKIVRRARGAAWERAQRPSGVTAQVRTAEVRSYLPSPTDTVAPEISALQIRSTDLPAPPSYESYDDVDAYLYSLGVDSEQDSETGAGDNAGGGRAEEPVLLIALSPHVELSWGKAAAQAAHAGQILWRDASADERRAWDEANRPIAVIHPSHALWAELLDHGAAPVRDGGFTEVAPGTLTACARWYPRPH